MPDEYASTPAHSNPGADSDGGCADAALHVVVRANPSGGTSASAATPAPSVLEGADAAMAVDFTTGGDDDDAVADPDGSFAVGHGDADSRGDAPDDAFEDSVDGGDDDDARPKADANDDDSDTDVEADAEAEADADAHNDAHADARADATAARTTIATDVAAAAANVNAAPQTARAAHDGSASLSPKTTLVEGMRVSWQDTASMGRGKKRHLGEIVEIEHDFPRGRSQLPRQSKVKLRWERSDALLPSGPESGISTWLYVDDIKQEPAKRMGLRRKTPLQAAKRAEEETAAAVRQANDGRSPPLRRR